MGSAREQDVTWREGGEERSSATAVVGAAREGDRADRGSCRELVETPGAVRLQLVREAQRQVVAVGRAAVQDDDADFAAGRSGVVVDVAGVLENGDRLLRVQRRHHRGDTLALLGLPGDDERARRGDHRLGDQVAAVRDLAPPQVSRCGRRLSHLRRQHRDTEDGQDRHDHGADPGRAVKVQLPRHEEAPLCL